MQTEIFGQMESAVPIVTVYLLKKTLNSHSDIDSQKFMGRTQGITQHKWTVVSMRWW